MMEKVTVHVILVTQETSVILALLVTDLREHFA